MLIIRRDKLCQYSLWKKVFFQPAHTKRRERPLLAKEGTISGIQLAICNSRKLLGSFTCRKAGTWDILFYFPSGGRHVEDFYVRKIQRLRPGLNPQTWVPEASMLTTRPPKPSFTETNKVFSLKCINMYALIQWQTSPAQSIVERRKLLRWFYFILTVHHVMTLGKWPTWCTYPFLRIYFYL